MFIINQVTGIIVCSSFGGCGRVALSNHTHAYHVLLNMTNHQTHYDSLLYFPASKALKFRRRSMPFGSSNKASISVHSYLINNQSIHLHIRLDKNQKPVEENHSYGGPIFVPASVHRRGQLAINRFRRQYCIFQCHKTTYNNLSLDSYL